MISRLWLLLTCFGNWQKGHSRKVKSFAKQQVSTEWCWSPFCNLQLVIIFTAGLVHCVVCLLTPQLSLTLILPNPEGWPGWVNVNDWLNTKPVLMSLKPQNGDPTQSNYVDWDRCATTMTDSYHRVTEWVNFTVKSSINLHFLLLFTLLILNLLQCTCHAACKITAQLLHMLLTLCTALHTVTNHRKNKKSCSDSV